MQASEFWKAVTVDESGFLDRLLDLLEREKVRYCVVGGQAVNAYVDPLVSLDLDLALAGGELERILDRFGYEFVVERFPHSLNLASKDSRLRVQIQLDSRYAAFVDRAELRDVLGRRLPVASLDDLVDGKVWAASDPTRRSSKRQKDLADLARLVERFPHVAERVPTELRAKLI
jgi:hypothetical protein